MSDPTHGAMSSPYARDPTEARELTAEEIRARNRYSCAIHHLHQARVWLQGAGAPEAENVCEDLAAHISALQDCIAEIERRPEIEWQDAEDAMEGV